MICCECGKEADDILCKDCEAMFEREAEERFEEKLVGEK